MKTEVIQKNSVNNNSLYLHLLGDKVLITVVVNNVGASFYMKGYRYTSKMSDDPEKIRFAISYLPFCEFPMNRLKNSIDYINDYLGDVENCYWEFAAKCGIDIPVQDCP